MIRSAIDPRPRVVRLKEAAELLSVSPKTVQRLIARGRLKRIEGLRYILISLREIDEFVNRSGSDHHGRTS
jgi:excisionase family DNA binding protein